MRFVSERGEQHRVKLSVVAFRLSRPANKHFGESSQGLANFGSFGLVHDFEVKSSSSIRLLLIHLNHPLLFLLLLLLLFEHSIQ